MPVQATRAPTYNALRIAPSVGSGLRMPISMRGVLTTPSISAQPAANIQVLGTATAWYLTVNGGQILAGLSGAPAEIRVPTGYNLVVQHSLYASAGPTPSIQMRAIQRNGQPIQGAILGPGSYRSFGAMVAPVSFDAHEGSIIAQFALVRTQNPKAAPFSPYGGGGSRRWPQPIGRRPEGGGGSGGGQAAPTPPFSSGTIGGTPIGSGSTSGGSYGGGGGYGGGKVVL